jgi:outer membrane protein TolC
MHEIRIQWLLRTLGAKLTLAAAVVAPLVLGLPVSAGAVLAQETPLTLDEAIEKALLRNPDAEAAQEAEKAGKARHQQAVARFLPRVDYIESWDNGNNPVYVFGSLLNQGRFTEENFAIDRLNNPDAVSNYRSQFVLQQPIFIGGQNILGLDGARIGLDIAEEGRRLAEMQVIFHTLRTYFGVQVSAENLNVIEKALASAEEDLNRAQALFDSGMVTEADLLSIKVHLAGLKEEQIRAKNALEVMKAELSQTIGEPLDSEFTLLTPLEYREKKAKGGVVEDLVVSAMENQPAAKMKSLEVESIRLKKKMSYANFLPTVALQAGWQSDRESFTGDGGSSWVVGLAMQINLFEGTGKFARASEAAAELKKAEAEKRKADDTIQLEVRRAYLDQAAAAERVEVARTAVEQARESHRITEARYEGGLSDVTELLRSQSALLDAEARYLGAIYGGRLAEARLELAVGTLHKESGAVKP